MGLFSDIGSALGGLGSIAGGVLGFMGSNNANNTAASIAASNNATALELANTAHQREVADLKAAGLNPILSAGGSGSASPSMQAAPVQNTMAGLSNSAASFASTAADIAAKMAQVDNVSADTANKRIQSALLTNQNTGADIANQAAKINLANLPLKSNSEALSASYQSDKAHADSMSAWTSADRNLIGKHLDELQVHSAKAAADLADIDSQYYMSGAGQLLRKLQLGGKATDDASSPVRHWLPFTQ